MEGIFAVYKPKGMTSHDVIHFLRTKTHVQRIGHAGTLDPSASGVLVIAIGRVYTKQLTDLIKKDKEYIVKAKLGIFSTTDDAEGQMTKVKVEKKPNTLQVKTLLQSFEGDINLRPPVYSAIKIQGKRAYALARKGKKVEIPERKAHIYSIKLLTYHWPYLSFRVVTGSGVYVRSIVRRMGDLLKTGAYVEALERIRVGDYKKEQALLLDSFVNL